MVGGEYQQYVNFSDEHAICYFLNFCWSDQIVVNTEALVQLYSLIPSLRGRASICRHLYQNLAISHTHAETRVMMRQSVLQAEMGEGAEIGSDLAQLINDMCRLGALTNTRCQVLSACLVIVPFGLQVQVGT